MGHLGREVRGALSSPTGVIMKVEVYRNLHRNCCSVRHNGRVISHVDSVDLKNATLVVQPAGRAKVLRENRKNVHAYIKGTVTLLSDDRVNNIPTHKVTYNPYRYSSFVLADTEQPITTADNVRLTKDGKVFMY